jgi:hypothetical protein
MCPGINFGQLEMEDYDNYQLSVAFKPPATPAPSLSTPSQTPAAIPLPSMLFQTPDAASYPMIPGFNLGPIPYTNPSTPGFPTYSFMTNVKLDVKAYPIFNGENASWSNFKRCVTSMACTHNLDDVFDVSYNAPQPGDPDYQLYFERNQFVFSMWTSRITAGLALSILRDFEKTKDGRGVYLKLLDIYECSSNKNQVATIALARLTNLKMTYNSNGGAPVYISQFRDALNDLRDAGYPIDDVMIKTMFLQKIQDIDYTHIVDALMISSDHFEVCMQTILYKYNLLANNKSSNDNRKANSTNSENGNGGKNRKKKGRNDTRKNNNNNSKTDFKPITYETVKATPYCVDSDTWRTMPEDKKQAVWAKVRAFNKMPTLKPKDKDIKPKYTKF